MKLHSDTITANGVVAALWAAKDDFNRQTGHKYVMPSVVEV